MNGTLTIANKTGIECAAGIPFARDVLSDNLSSWAKALLVVLAFLCIVSVLIFVEEVVFLVKNFRGKTHRLSRTIWILSVFPIYTLTAYLAILIPRAGTLINLVENSVLGSVVYQLIELIVDYLGGWEGMWTLVGESRQITLRTPPLCCCCICLPYVTMSRKTFRKFYNLVLQVTIVRPLLMFIAAVLWMDNLYIPGYLFPNNAFLYVTAAQLASTLLAIWGLVILKTAFKSELDKQYLITGKIACIQLTLLLTSISSITCGVLVVTGVIGCTGLLTSKARGDVLFHMVLVVLMCVLGIISRFCYRRSNDGEDNACSEVTFKTSTNQCAIGDSTTDLNGNALKTNTDESLRKAPVNCNIVL